MKSRQISGTSIEPQELEDLEGIKIFSDISRLLTLQTRRDAQVVHEPGTVDKASLMILTAAMASTSIEGASKILQAISSVVQEILVEIRDSPEPLKALERAIAALDPGCKDKVLVVHRTTVSSMIPSPTRDQLDQELGNQAIDCYKDLEEVGMKSTRVTIAMDDTHQDTSTKYPNQHQSDVFIGQANKWSKGLLFPSEYDATHQIFIGMRHRDKRIIDDKKNELRPLLTKIANTAETLQGLGINPAVVEGDRGYFEAEFFAASFAGTLDESGLMSDPSKGARFISPRKFTREKESFKWNYLVGNEKPQVFLDYIRLNPYTHPALKDYCHEQFERTADYRYLVPYACVAMVDEYSTKSCRTLEELREEASRTRDAIEQKTIALDEAIKVYMEYCTSLGKKKVKAPSFGRGKRRTVFKNSREKRLYEVCYKAHDALAKWKGKKRELLKSLMFFAISIIPGEDPEATPSMFMTLARDYHERWGIENGFLYVKESFLLKNRSRKPVKRQFFVTLSMMLYNRWQVKRRQHAATWFKKNDMCHGPADWQRPWVRRKIEQECPYLPTAVGFLADCWREGILSLMKKKIRGEI